MLGFPNRWYAEAIAHAVDVQAEGERFPIVDAPHFCATKLDSYADRCKGDVFHHDIEDVVALAGGRAELHGELAAAGDRVPRYVVRRLRGLVQTPAFLEALPGHPPGDAAGQARLPLVIQRPRAWASLV